MAIIQVTRWKGNLAEAQRVTREAAPIVKRHGAVSIRIGPCYSGPHAGQLYIAIIFADWASFGRAQHALATDADFRGLYAEGLKAVELQERSLLVTEDL
jgi:hypothetical protein